MSQNYWYPPGSASAGSVIANQGTPNNDANAWPVRITDGTHDATVTAGGALNVNVTSSATPQHVIVDSSALPANAAQETGGHLASIDSKLTNPLPVSGPLTDAQLRATPVPVSISSGISNPLPVTDAAAEASLASIDSKLTNPLPISGTVTANAGTNLNTSALNLEATQLALSAKSASAFINSPFDETVITYVGVTTNIATVVYKLASVTVNTLTLTYDGSNRLIDVVKT